ncbi:hypothetical protein I5H14_gp071 [Mycobacterium phage Batiatus]|uniref:Uncharacterized protein n=1 Tax=Mycobacterium phage Batiatus TaxID=2126812 RepID=A0A2P1N158_9CAUD|nr:hypothetical protein I5H14_gp071 [Mycobacterium phage Batiatus]AVP41727.1 hypothetical protein SEA_BATIATUS_71 [Mycobacterium phage Batiatus]
MSDQARIAELIRPWLRRRRDAEDVAELIAQLVYPRIETVEQLDALPEGSVVRNDESRIFEKGGEVSLMELYGPWFTPGCEVPDPSEALTLPARVLYSGLDEFHPDTTRNPNA